MPTDQQVNDLRQKAIDALERKDFKEAYKLVFVNTSSVLSVLMHDRSFTELLSLNLEELNKVKEEVKK